MHSGEAVLAALLRQGVDAIGIDVQKNIVSVLMDTPIDRVFNILHGKLGEDGVLQGALELMGIPYTGSGVMASALGMDKPRCKDVWVAKGLPTPKYRVVSEASELNGLVEYIGLPCIAKPVCEGSSVGISKVEAADQLAAAFNHAQAFDNSVLFEQWVQGKEYTAAFLGREALPLIWLETPRALYDYEAKYLLDTTQYHCPCGLLEDVERSLQSMCLQAFDAVGATQWGRVDFMMDEQGQPWLIEVNTVPGMTDHSLVPKAAQQAGVSFDELVLHILDESMRAQSE